MTTIGLIGLGHMGTPMALNLLKASYILKVYDVSKPLMQSLVAKGATAAATLTELAKDSDVIITMVQTGQQVKEICLGSEGIFHVVKKEAIYIDCSSIDIKMSREIHAEALARHIAMVDAPVSGGVAGAAAGTLTFMVGGSEENFLRAKTILESLGKKIVHAGAPGNGQAAKICNNLILAISMIGVCEGFNLGKKLGLDPKKLFEISSNASGQCWSMTSYCPVPDVMDNVPANNNYQPGFMAKMMLKDLKLAESAAQSVDAALPLGLDAMALYTVFVEQGNGDMDFSGIIKMINEMVAKIQ